MIEGAGAQTRALGIDVGAERLHCVVLEAGGRIVDARVLRADDLDGVCALAATVSATAVDAPAAPSTAPHASDASLSAKFGQRDVRRSASDDSGACGCRG